MQRLTELSSKLASWQRTGMSQWQWKQLRGHIWGEQRGTCASPGCSNSVESPYWQLHHLDGNPRNNTRGNLRLICKSCHDRLHYVPGEQWAVEAWEKQTMEFVIKMLEKRGHSNSSEGVKQVNYESLVPENFRLLMIDLHNRFKSSLGSSVLMDMYRELIKTWPMSEEEYGRRLANGLSKGWWWLRSGAPFGKSAGHLKIGFNSFYYLKLR